MISSSDRRWRNHLAAGKAPQVIQTGQAVCQDWDNGATFEKEVADLTGVTDWTDYQAGSFHRRRHGRVLPRLRYKVS